MCAKCGLMLCEDCSFVVGTRRYCESCLLSDNNLIQDFQYMISRQLQIGKVATVVDYDGPQKWSEVPSALLNMLKDSDIFFRGAYKTPYWITFPVAFLALLPNAFITYVVKLDDIVVRYASEYQATQNADVAIDASRESGGDVCGGGICAAVPNPRSRCVSFCGVAHIYAQAPVVVAGECTRQF